MALVEIQLNRLRVNSVEYSPNVVDASPGTAVHIHITNFGAPAHITLKAEGPEYTSYTYDNLFIESESEIHIPVLSTAPDGTFSIQLITSYGMHRDELKVAVHKAQPEPEPIENDPLEAMMRQEYAGSKKSSSGYSSYNSGNSESSGRGGRFALAMIAPAVGLAFLLLYIFLPLSTYLPWLSSIIMGILLFAVMLIGVFLAWFLAK